MSKHLSNSSLATSMTPVSVEELAVSMRFSHEPEARASGDTTRRSLVIAYMDSISRHSMAKFGPLDTICVDESMSR